MKKIIKIIIILLCGLLISCKKENKNMNENITIENEKLKVTLMSQGATLKNFYVKEKDVDIVLSLRNEAKYLEPQSKNMGKVVGRCANRIAKGEFIINDKKYKVKVNNGPNSLHGGEVNFGNIVWDVKEKTKDSVTFFYRSKDMEAGYPGNLDITLTYKLNGNELSLSWTGISDKDTIFNLTNHSYFNLDKSKTNILNHELKINAEEMNLNDENGMAREETLNVANTLLDFRKFKKIGDVVASGKTPFNSFCQNIFSMTNDKSLMLDNIDANFTTEFNQDFSLTNVRSPLDEKVLCELKNDELKLSVISDLPDVQIFTANTMDVDGVGGHYGSYAGVAMEAQFCPNAINYSKFVKPLIKAKEKNTHSIIWRVENVK